MNKNQAYSVAVNSAALLNTVMIPNKKPKQFFDKASLGAKKRNKKLGRVIKD